MNEMNRVPFITRAGTTVASGRRMNHQEAGLGQGEAGHDWRGCLGLAGTLQGCAAPGSSSGRPEQSPGGEVTSRSLEGTDSQGRDGSKGPKRDLAITARPRERLPGGRGGVARCPRKRSWKAAAFAPGTWDDTGWAGRLRSCDPGPLLPLPSAHGP